MSLIEDLEKMQDDEKKKRQEIKNKYGDYTGDSCPNCGRVRIMMGGDGQQRCEKCHWNIDVGEYDEDLF